MADPVSPEFLALQRAVAGRYSLERELGRGGMGIVFLARDVALDRFVAIKLLPPALAEDLTVPGRFLREARTAAGLAHPHIVPIHAVEEQGGLVYFVMGFVEGETLGARVRRDGPLPPADVMRIVQEVAWALGHAHAHGVVHRDVKPDNVLLERETGRALVTDFGIARSAETNESPSSGAVRGTPQYMSPEQVMGAAVDGRTDLYALGATAFFAATGRPPFESDTVAGLLAKHAGERPPPVTRFAPHLPTKFAGAVDRCLEKDPGARFGNAEELVAEIRAARGVLVQVPADLRRFCDDARAAGVEVATYAGTGVSLVVVFEVIKAIEGDFLGLTSAIELLGVTALGGLLASRLIQLGGHVRALRAAGYDHRALVAALDADERERALEPVGRENRREVWLAATAGILTTGLGVLLLRMNGEWAPVFGFALSVAAPALTLRQLWTRVGGTRLWNRLLKGRLGRAFVKLAGLGMKEVPALPAAGEHTEIALGRAADALFQALPVEKRRQLGDVPALVERLEEDAMTLRQRVDDAAAEKRLGSVVAALETLRLDLLRLAAGTGTIGELTENLAAARKVGEEVDAALAARRELEEVSGRSEQGTGNG
jgi:hypothetical protein